MHKTNSGYLLILTLAFSTAHAPSFQLWRNLPAAPTDETNLLVAASGGSFGAGGTADVQRDYGEEDDLKRFQVDQLYLPSLDISLPELFEWSDLDRKYLADAGTHYAALEFASDISAIAAFRTAALDRGFIATGSFGAGASAASAASGGSETSGTQTGSPGQASKGEPSSSSNGGTTPSDETHHENDQLAANDLPPALHEPLPSDEHSGEHPPVIQDPTPVSVPAPGALWLFGLGLAGLAFGRPKHNRKRFAAS